MKNPTTPIFSDEYSRIFLTSIKVMIGFFSLNTRHTHQTGLRPGKARSPGDNFKWTQKMKRKCRKQNALMYVEHTYSGP